MTQKYPETLPRAQVAAGIRALGIDPEHLAEMIFQPDRLTLTVYELDERGERQAHPNKNEARVRLIWVGLV